MLSVCTFHMLVSIINYRYAKILNVLLWHSLRYAEYNFSGAERKNIHIGNAGFNEWYSCT